MNIKGTFYGCHNLDLFKILYEKKSTVYEELKELRKKIKVKKESKCILKELKIVENKFLQKKKPLLSIPNNDEQIESLTNVRKITDFFFKDLL